jgi:hypothetical protein
MSVKVGDRYACPDSECGCKVEVRTISRSSVRNVETRTSEVPETDTSLRSLGGSNLATPDNFGSQGATGEGVFGTAGGGSAATHGRYGSGSSSAPSGTSSQEPGQRNPTCFCGREMRKVGQSQVRSTSAGV